MATPERNPTACLIQEPGNEVDLDRLSFVSLVWLLERLTASSVRIGSDGPPGAEGIRFHHDPSLSFSARDVSQVESKVVPIDPADPLSPDHRVYQVTTAFLGLTGSVAPLPSYLPEEVAQEDPDRPLRREFLDLFHHRLLSLLYRELAHFQLWAEQTSDLRDGWSCRLLALLGLDSYEHPLPEGVSARELLRLAPVLALGSRTALGLELAIETVLGSRLEGARIKVREFAGKWVQIDLPQRTRLGGPRHQLGREVILGRQVYDRAGGFEIQIGPVQRPLYERFLPNGDLLIALQQLVSMFVRDPLHYRVLVELAEGQVPSLQLLGTRGYRLGRDCWLGARKRKTWVETYPRPSEAQLEPIAGSGARA